MEFNENIFLVIPTPLDTVSQPFYTTASSYLKWPLGINHIPVKYFAIIA